MIKRELTCKALFMAVVLLLPILPLIAANRYSVATGNWNATATWSAASGGAPGASFPVAGDNVFIENGHTVTVTANAACSNITFTGFSGTLTVNTSVSVTVSGTLALNHSSAATVSTISGEGSLSCTSVAVGAGSVGGSNFTTYTHTITSTIAIFNISADLTITSYRQGQRYRDGVFNLESGIVTVGGSIVTDNQNAPNISTFSMASGIQAGTLILNGAAPFSLSGLGTNIINLFGTSSLVNYSLAGDQPVYTTIYRNLILSGSGVKTVSGITVNGILSMEGTATAAGTVPAYGGTASLQYKGSIAQTTGIEFPSSFSGSGGIIINNANGITLDNNKTINSILTFIDGIITTGTNTLIIGSAATVSGGGSGKYVFGYLQKDIATGTASKLFEIGDVSVYAPVNIEFTGTTNNTGNITVYTTVGDHPNIGSAEFSPATVNRYWTLINSGVSGFTSYNATFNFVAEDLDDGADYNYFISGNYNASSWTYPTIGAKTSTSLQATGMSTFGDFQIGESLEDSFRSIASGNWNQTGTWEVYASGSWVAATITPTSSSRYIYIRSPDYVTNTTSITIDQVIIDSGGTLILNSGMDVDDGPGIDFTSYGTIECVATEALTGAGSFMLAASSTISIGSPDGITLSGATGSIQTTIRTFNTAANYIYNGTGVQVTGNGLPATVNNLTITNSADLTLSASLISNENVTLTSGTNLTLNGQILSLVGILLCDGTVNSGAGNITLLSTVTQTALIDGSGSGQVLCSVIMQRYLPSGFGYKYFSSPFQSATVNEFSDDITLGAFTFFRYDESRTSSGWVSYHTPTTNPLNPMEGYAVNFGSVDAPNTVDVTGVVTNGNVSATLYNNNNTYTQGFNLAGNPYPSPIDWDAASGWTKTSIDDAVYYFKASTTDQYGGTYSSYISGVSSDGLATNVIPSMQGFFVHITDGSYPVTGTLGMDNNVRITDLTHSFLKSSKKSSVPLLRLAASFSDDSVSTDPVLIYFDYKGSPEFDNQLDALKLFNTDLKVPNLFSVTPSGRKLSINALPVITDDLYSVPLGLKLNRAGNIIIKIRDIDESLSGMRIYLSDIIAGTENDLLPDKEFTLSLDIGEYLNRFFLNFSNITTDIIDNSPVEDIFTIYSYRGILKAGIKILHEKVGTIRLYNLTGQLLFIEKIYETGYHEFNPGVKNGIYIVSYISGTERISKKIYIQN